MESFTRKTTGRCREHARECRDLAEGAETAEQRLALLELAHHWDAVAEILERHPLRLDDDQAPG
jgi:hypothetical protein